MMALDPSVAAGREPDRRYARYSPLPSVAMSAEDEIDGVVVFQLIEDIGRMGQQEGEAVWRRRRQAAQIGPMQRGIIDADNRKFAEVCGNEGGLVDQERNLVTIGHVAILIDRDAAIVVMISQGDEDRRNLAQPGEKSKQMGQSLRYIEQVAGDKDPVGAEFPDTCDNEVMSWLIAVKMKIGQMDSPPAGQRSIYIGKPGDLVGGQSDFPVGNDTKEPIERFAQTMSDE